MSSSSESVSVAVSTPTQGGDVSHDPSQCAPQAPDTPSTAALLLQEHVASGLVCGVCKVELFDTDECLECTSKVPDCERQYHATCVVTGFGKLYSQKELKMPQPRQSKWRCMACSDICVVCVPATKIVAGAAHAFYRCQYCKAKAHQHHWQDGESKICFYCRLPM